MGDGSLIETKLYEAIQLPKPRARGAKNKKRSKNSRRDANEPKKQNKIKNAAVKVADKPSTGSAQTNGNSNAHSDVFAMFGEMFTNGTKPDKRSSNVEDVLSDSNSLSKQQQQQNNQKSSDPLDIFGFLGDENTESKENDKSNQKQKKKKKKKGEKEKKKKKKKKKK